MLALASVLGRARTGAGQRGTGLLELVVAGGLLAAGLLGLLGLYGSAVRSERDARTLARADTLADDLLEELAAVPSAELPGRAGEATPIEVGGVRFRRSVAVVPAPGSETLMRVRVEIEWGAGRRTSLSTLRTTLER